MTAVEVSGPVLHARIPGSKSLTNRAVLIAATARGTSRVWAPLVSDDTGTFRNALAECGVRVESSPLSEFWEVTGTGRGPVGRARLWCADAGTAARFLPPYAASGHGTFLFNGSSQLRARPQRPLLEALHRLGADVEAGPGEGLPLLVRADGLTGGELAVESSLSSQYLSGLLMAAPLMERGLLVRAEALVSSPYVDMTVALMRRFGARVDERSDGGLRVEPGGYTATDVVIEPDASTASYVFAAAAVTGRTISVPGLTAGSLQGDLRFVEVLKRAGARVAMTDSATSTTGTGRLRGGFTVHMGDISDTFMTLAAIDAGGRAHHDPRHRTRTSEGVRPHRRGRPEPAGLRHRNGAGRRLEHRPPGCAAPGTHRLPSGPPHRDGVLGARPRRARNDHPRRSGMRDEDVPGLPRGDATPLPDIRASRRRA
jgi:3-phosphoshikimate 1-carboxyvinyltransferase